MVTYFTGVCSTFLSDLAHADKSGLDQMQMQHALESVQFHQALPIYAYKPDFLGKLKQQQCVVLRSSAGSGNASICCGACACPLCLFHTRALQSGKRAAYTLYEQHLCL